MLDTNLFHVSYKKFTCCIKAQKFSFSSITCITYRCVLCKELSLLHVCQKQPFSPLDDTQRYRAETSNQKAHNYKVFHSSSSSLFNPLLCHIHLLIQSFFPCPLSHASHTLLTFKSFHSYQIELFNYMQWSAWSTSLLTQSFLVDAHSHMWIRYWPVLCVYQDARPLL